MAEMQAMQGAIACKATIDAKSDQEQLASVTVSEVGNNLVRGEKEKTPRL
jgi:hypothetical protein